MNRSGLFLCPEMWASVRMLGSGKVKESGQLPPSLFPPTATFSAVALLACRAATFPGDPMLP